MQLWRSSFARAQGLFREPLLQFALLGALLFAVDRYVLDQADDPRRIVVDAERRAELASIFEDGQGRPPSDEELQDLIVTWTQNEVLYREALAMNLDQGDEMIKNRVILKLRNVLFGNVVVDPPGEPELRAWFEEHRARYDRPAAFDFEQFHLAGVETKEQARAAADELGRDPVPEDRADELRKYAARPASNLESMFGADAAEALLTSSTGVWVPIESPRGWHLARIAHRRPAQAARFRDHRARVAEEWSDRARRANLAKALERIVSQYDIRVVGGPEPTPKKVSLSDSATKGPDRERRP